MLHASLCCCCHGASSQHSKIQIRASIVLQSRQILFLVLLALQVSPFGKEYATREFKMCKRVKENVLGIPGDYFWAQLTLHSFSMDVLWWQPTTECSKSSLFWSFRASVFFKYGDQKRTYGAWWEVLIIVGTSSMSQATVGRTHKRWSGEQTCEPAVASLLSSALTYSVSPLLTWRSGFLWPPHCPPGWCSVAPLHWLPPAHPQQDSAVLALALWPGENRKMSIWFVHTTHL